MEDPIIYRPVRDQAYALYTALSNLATFWSLEDCKARLQGNPDQPHLLDGRAMACVVGIVEMARTLSESCVNLPGDDDPAGD